ncbi:MAG: hypothetical protein MJ224_03090, partial [archaeon]|nr:hypothetical protein [archaeon]
CFMSLFARESLCPRKYYLNNVSFFRDIEVDIYNDEDEIWIHAVFKRNWPLENIYFHILNIFNRSHDFEYYSKFEEDSKEDTYYTAIIRNNYDEVYFKIECTDRIELNKFLNHLNCIFYLKGSLL